MPGSGTRTFLESDHYEASLRQGQIEITVSPRGQFNARLTWAELHCLQVLRCEEEFPRPAYLSLAPQLSFVTFPTQSARLPVWRGTALQPDDIMLHGSGDRLHQLTFGPCIWSVIALDPLRLEDYGRALSGKPFSRPTEGQILHPSSRHAARLRLLHGQICRLAETRPKVLSHPEVAHALEQDLIQALVICLTNAAARADGDVRRRSAEIMIRFEEVLTGRLGAPLRMPELCELIGVTERALRTSCAEFLGVSPTRYVLLRRLREARIALRDADPNVVTIAELADHFGFAQVGRFSAAYRAVFGETPETTLQRVPRFWFATR